jgi:hypothetical protein
MQMYIEGMYAAKTEMISHMLPWTSIETAVASAQEVRLTR